MLNVLAWYFVLLKKINKFQTKNGNLDHASNTYPQLDTSTRPWKLWKIDCKYHFFRVPGKYSSVMQAYRFFLNFIFLFCFCLKAIFFHNSVQCLSAFGVGGRVTHHMWFTYIYFGLLTNVFHCRQKGSNF